MAMLRCKKTGMVLADTIPRDTPGLPPEPEDATHMHIGKGPCGVFWCNGDVE